MNEYTEAAALPNVTQQSTHKTIQTAMQNTSSRAEYMNTRAYMTMYSL
jgi:hypothetical protein